MTEARRQSLEESARDYERAEVTLLWVDDHGTHNNVFAVVELCPSEQSASPRITSVRQGTGEEQLHKRVRLRDGVYLVAKRIIDMDPDEAIAVFRGVNPQGYGIRTENGPVIIRTMADLSYEPDTNHYITLPSDSLETGWSGALPRRELPLRVCARLGAASRTVATFFPSAGQQTKLWRFTTDTLGFDLGLYPELIGGVILCATNHLCRRIRFSLSRSAREILVRLFEREGKSVRGGHLELSDDRGSGKGFSVSRVLESCRLVVPVPYEPQRLRVRVFDANQNLLQDDAYSFVTDIDVEVGIASHMRRITLTGADGTPQVISIPVVDYERRLPDAPTVRAMIVEGDRKRALAVLQKDRRFIYFKGGDSSARQARFIVTNLIMRAQRRCIICDPYFSADDLTRYAPCFRLRSRPLKILSSVAFLKEPTQTDPPITEAKRLQDAVNALVATDRTISVSIRLLRGRDKSPLHDRFIVVDDDVYLLGSSLAEYGSRATTLFRAPDTTDLLTQFDEWWNGGATVSLADWVANHAPR